MAIRKDTNEEKAKIEVSEKLPTIEREDNNISANEPNSVSTDLSNNPIEPSSGTTLPNITKNEQDNSGLLLDETKKNIARAAEEATTLTANFAEAISSCQNQNIQIVKEFAEIFVDVQRRFVNSFEKSWVPNWEKTVTSLYSELFSPQRFSELYTNFLSNYASLIINVNRTISYNFLKSMDLFNNTLVNVKDTSDDLVRASARLTSIEERKMQKSTEEANTVKTTSKVKSESTQS
jgi:hypothetical protein